MNNKKTAPVWEFTTALLFSCLLSSCGGSSSTPTPPPPPVGTWSTISTVGAPSILDVKGECFASSNSHIIVWGGYSPSLNTEYNTGYIYDIATDTWSSMSDINAPSSREDCLAVWTGTDFILWGGKTWDDLSLSYTYPNDGYVYNVASDTWTPIATLNAPDGREDFTAIWTGTEMIIWGGEVNFVTVNTGGRYNPTTDAWTPTTTTGAPIARSKHSAVYTGIHMAIVGDVNIESLGWLYSPTTDSWTPMNATGEPTLDFKEELIWTGTEVMFFGGRHDDGFKNAFYAYNPATSTWRVIDAAWAPSPRMGHNLIWTGQKYLVWGGYVNPDIDGNPTDVTNTGGLFNPSTNTWETMTTLNAPEARGRAVGAWGNGKFVVWDGSVSCSGGIFTP